MFKRPNKVAGSIGSDPRDFGAVICGGSPAGASPDVPPDGAEPDGPSSGLGP